LQLQPKTPLYQWGFLQVDIIPEFISGSSTLAFHRRLTLRNNKRRRSRNKFGNYALLTKKPRVLCPGSFMGKRLGEDVSIVPILTLYSAQACADSFINRTDKMPGKISYAAVVIWACITYVISTFPFRPCVIGTSR